MMQSQCVSIFIMMQAHSVRIDVKKHSDSVCNIIMKQSHCGRISITIRRHCVKICIMTQANIVRIGVMKQSHSVSNIIVRTFDHIDMSQTLS